MYIKFQKKLQRVSDVVLPDNTTSHKMRAVLKADVLEGSTVIEKGKVFEQIVEFKRIIGSEQFSGSVSFIFDADLYIK